MERARLAAALTTTLVFSTTTPNQLSTPLSFYELQSVMPVRIVGPPSVLLALVGLLLMTLGIISGGVVVLRRRAIS